MSIECPASGCDYTGMLDAVEGHVGGKADALHEGVVIPQVGNSLTGGEGSGEDFEIPLWVLIAVGVVALGLLYYAGSDGGDQLDEQAEPAGEMGVESDTQEPELPDGGLS